MKKLLFSILAILSLSTFAITAQEAIDSKNYYTILDYCRTNKIYYADFLCRSNDLSFTDMEIIYNSCTNSNSYSLHPLKKSLLVKYGDAANKLQTVYSKSLHNYLCLNFLKEKNYKNYKYCYIFYGKSSNTNNKYYYAYKWIYDIMKEDMEKSLIITNSTKMAINMDSTFGNNTMKNIIYPRCTNSFIRLDLDIAYNDVDKIIDELSNFNFSKITADQVSKIIPIINAVANEYRKAEILTILKNINSACTINLYDDQKTWEPLLSKIRAMISVRQ